jgi:hypothetical protein
MANVSGYRRLTLTDVLQGKAAGTVASLAWPFLFREVRP